MWVFSEIAIYRTRLYFWNTFGATLKQLLCGDRVEGY